MLRTNILQPVNHSSNRTVFHLNNEGKAVLSAMRLVGLTTSRTGGTDPTTSQYLANTGVYALFKRLTLYSKGQVLSQCGGGEVAQWLSFKNIAGKQQGQMRDINQYLNLSMNAINGGEDRHQIQKLHIDDTLNASLEARVNLQMMLPFLEETPVLADIPDLRLEIQWETDVSKVFQTANKPTSFTIPEPLMVYEEVVDEKEVSKLINEMAKLTAVVRDIEVERVSVAATTNGVLQQVKERLNAYRGKIVRRMLITLVDSTSNDYLGLNKSQAQRNPKWNVVVNNRKVFPYQGLNSDARVLAEVCDTWSSLAIPNGSDKYKLALLSDNVVDTQPRGWYSDLAYVGFGIHDKITDLDFEFERLGDTDRLNAFTMYVFAETERYYKRSGDDWETGYME